MPYAVTLKLQLKILNAKPILKQMVRIKQQLDKRKIMSIKFK